jgi:hypothetical protein
MSDFKKAMSDISHWSKNVEHRSKNKGKIARNTIIFLLLIIVSLFMWFFKGSFRGIKGFLVGLLTKGDD